MTFSVPEDSRAKSRYGRDVDLAAVGSNCGAFLLASPIPRRRLYCIASDGQGWEHVSVSAYSGRKPVTPTWVEMCGVKATFWGPEDVVIQYHPAEADYVNDHEHCLHLWRPIGVIVPQPDPILVGLTRKEGP